MIDALRAAYDAVYGPELRFDLWTGAPPAATAWQGRPLYLWVLIPSLIGTVLVCALAYMVARGMVVWLVNAVFRLFAPANTGF